MKYVAEFRDGGLALRLGEAIRREALPGRQYRLMEFCGGHTHAISRHGISGLLPGNVHMVHGPGCPVCVLPVGRIDNAIGLALERGVILCAYGDCLRVPASGRLSLLKARSLGGDIRMVYSPADALRIARENPSREVVFFGIGFETTTPPTALLIRAARAEGRGNLSVLCNHVLTPPAIAHVLESSGDGGQDGLLDGFIGPAHVSAIIGSRPFEPFAAKYRKPVVVAGFEPLDVMQAILMLLRQLNQGRAEVENEFTRVVTREGNLKAQALVHEVMVLRPVFEWRGLGKVPHSALGIRSEFGEFDAERRFGIEYVPVPDNRGCECGAILRGIREPRDCRLFGTVCTPDNPMGSCMVSSEGACAAHFSYGRYRDAPVSG